MTKEEQFRQMWADIKRIQKDMKALSSRINGIMLATAFFSPIALTKYEMGIIDVGNGNEACILISNRTGCTIAQARAAVEAYKA